MKLRFSALAATVVAVVLSAAFGAGAAPQVSTTAAPVEMNYACSLKSNGLMRYVTNLNQCKNTEEKITIKPGPWSLCIQPDGSVRKIPPFQCKKPGTVLIIPPTSGTVYFCAQISTGVLRYVTSPSQCTSTEFPVFVTPNDTAPSVILTVPPFGLDTVVATGSSGAGPTPSGSVDTEPPSAGTSPDAVCGSTTV